MDGNKINEAEVENPTQDPGADVQNEEKENRRKKRDFYVEMFLLLVLGILLGVAIKSEALKRVSIGFNDYQMKIVSNDYDINKLEKELAAKQQEAQASGDQQGTQDPGAQTDQSGSCGN